MYAICASLPLALLLALSVSLPARAQQSLEKLERILAEEAAEPQPASPKAPAASAVEVPRTDPAPGYLGLYAIEVDGGLIVESVRPDSPAEAASIRPGDQILRMGGAPLSTLDELGQMLEPLTAGTRVSLLVKRNGRDVPLLAVLGPRPASLRVAERRDTPVPTPATEPVVDSFGALSELERLLEDAPPSDDDLPPTAEPTPASDAPVVKRVELLEAELRRINARIGLLERTLDRVGSAVKED